MIHPAIPFTLLALAAPTAAAALQDLPDLQGVELAQLSIHERIIIRVPRMSLPPQRPAAMARTQVAPLEWKERKGPKCVAVADIAGAMIGPKGSVDMLMDDGSRLRARLDGDCRPLDYYPGFYLRPAADGRICRDRDAIRMRSGASCDIDDFKTLEIRR